MLFGTWPTESGVSTPAVLVVGPPVGGVPDVGEQTRAFQAFRQAWTAPPQDKSRLAGLYVWNWYGYGGPATTSYTPRGKPAVDVIRQILEEL